MLRFIYSLFSIRKWIKRLFWGFLIFLGMDLAFPLPKEKAWSKVVLDRKGGLLDAFLAEDDKWRMRVSLEEVNPDLVKAIIAKEDRWFYSHPGVNPFAILRAGFNNVVKGRRTSGASTITMQVARMIEPKPRTFLGKLWEMFRAFQLEWHHSKEEILELYLSYLPYGGNVEGVKAASYLYFDRPPAQLSLAQATLLTVVPNRPNSLRVDRFSEAAQGARDKWLRNFKARKVFPDDQVAAALAEPVPAERFEIVPKAPHFSWRMGQRYPGNLVQTTLDPEIQNTVEQLLEAYVNKARTMGVSNGAVLVVDNANSEVVAYCGSADFFDVFNSGQVDGVRAVRSPGSTLKPGVYAMAFDQGLITPHSRLLDVPTVFGGGYAPENYDMNYYGAVPADEALRNSLNLPVVRLLRDLGLDRYLDLMDDAGFEAVKRKRKDLGLSVILGGCGVSLEELTRFYSSFARGGKMFPLAYTLGEAAGQRSGVQLFSEGSAFLIGDILSGIERPDLPKFLVESTTRARVAWKTGTSFGRRDAWSVGFSPRYTIGVWMGNFSGEGVPELSGAKVAVPLLFELFNALDRDWNERSFDQPGTVWSRLVCSETGELPSDACEHLVKGKYLRGVSPRRVCSHVRTFFISADSSMHYCTECLPDSGFVRASYPVYPPELRLFWSSNDVGFKAPPPHNPNCTGVFDGKGPQIVSPTPEYEYFLEQGSEQEILLQAASAAGVDQHHWYVNGRFVGTVEAGEKVFFRPDGGMNTVACVDDLGRRTGVEIKVKFY